MKNKIAQKQTKKSVNNNDSDSSPDNELIDDKITINPKKANNITFMNIFINFTEQVNNETYKNLIKNEMIFKRKGFSCCPNNLLNKNLILEKENILAITKLQYNSLNNEHFEIMKYIYLFFTKDQNCKPLGKHWEKLGFQDENPNKDFRSTGMLVPLQVLYLIENYSSLASSFYNISILRKCEWLFFTILIQLTKISLDVLKNGSLHYFCNIHNSVILTLNLFFCGLCHLLHNTLFNEYKEKLGEINEIKAEDVNFNINILKKYAYNNINSIIEEGKNIIK